MRKIIIGFLLILCLASCGDINQGNTSTPNIEAPSDKDMFTEKDNDYSYSNELNINLSKKEGCINATFTNDFLKITKEGTYKITGEFAGYILVEANSNDKIQLVLTNVNINSSNYACIYIKSASKVFITLEGENELISSGDFIQTDDNTVDGVIFSKTDITINGEGKLVINSSCHGIVGKDDVKIVNTNIKITSTGHGIQANNSIRIDGGRIDIDSGKDGIQASLEGDETKGFVYIQNALIEILSEYDGITASTTNTISNSEITIRTTSASAFASTKGIKAAGNIVLTDVKANISSMDDSIHSNSSLKISGGTYEIGSLDDGIHADTSIVIEEATINITRSYEGIEAQNITINGCDIDIAASDDGMNAAGGNDSSSVNGRPGQNNFDTDANAFLIINSGNLYINASGDGLDSNGFLEVNGGYIIIEGPTNNGNGALDYGISAKITGGVILAIGASGMAENFTEATQGSILLTFTNQSAKSVIKVLDANSKVIFEFTASKSYSSIVFSSPEITKGESYTISAGSYSTNITMTNNIYGKSNGMGGGGFMPGGRPR